MSCEFTCTRKGLQINVQKTKLLVLGINKGEKGMSGSKKVDHVVPWVIKDDG